MEPITTIAIAGASAFASQDLLNKVLGPTAEYIGGEMKGLLQRCNVNLGTIFNKAYSKLGARAEQPGQVPPRILKEVLDEGRFCEDPLVADYYAGVLAASKTQNRRDDRGVSVLAMIKSLSSYQVRFHCVFYETVRMQFRGTKHLIGPRGNLMRLYIPFRSFCAAMLLPVENESWNFLVHVTEQPARMGILGNDGYGNVEYLQKSYAGAKENGLLLQPTTLGAEVFLWALGVDGANGHHILHSEYEHLQSPVSALEDVEAVYPPPE